MIETFEGRLGGGKTYTVVTRAMDVWRRGGTVFANVEFNWDACLAFAERRWDLVLKREQWRELSSEQIVEFHKHTAAGTADMPTLTIIDEAHIHLGVLEHGRGSIKPLFDFLTQSRKQNSDVIFITQNAKNIDGRIGRLVQFVWRFRDLEKWNIPGLGSFPSLVKMLTLGFMHGRMILQTCFDYDGKTVNEKRWVNKDPEVFALYNTNALLSPIPRLEVGETTHKLERSNKKKGLVKRMPWIKYAIPVLLALGAWAVYSMFGYVREWRSGAGPGSDKKTRAAVSAPGVPGKTATAGAAKVAIATSEVAYDLRSERWFSVGPGYMRVESGTYYVGRLSAHGFVEAVQDFTVRIRQANGRTLYIVGNDEAYPGADKPTPDTAETVDMSTLSPVKTAGAGARPTPAQP